MSKLPAGLMATALFSFALAGCGSDSTPAPSPTSTPTPTPTPTPLAATRTIVMVWDGLRPDDVNATDTPNLYAMQRRA